MFSPFRFVASSLRRSVAQSLSRAFEMAAATCNGREKMKRYISILNYIFIITALAATLSGCSSVNQDSPLSLLDASGNHPDGWVEAHRQYALPDGSFCVDCHFERSTERLSD